MPDWSILTTFALLWAAIVPTPGANSLMVTHVALTAGPRQVAAAIAGNMLGILLISGAALIGMAGLLAAFPSVRLAINALGAIYLMWLGARLMRASSAPAVDPQQSSSDTALAGPIGFRQAFTLGLLTQLSNAQAVVFVTSLFALAGVLDADAGTGLACMIAIVIMNAGYLGTLGWLFQRRAVRTGYERWRGTLLKVAGLLFIGLGLRLLWRAFAPAGR